jgi:Mrp family chromosome partitioning ATPase
MAQATLEEVLQTVSVSAGQLTVIPAGTMPQDLVERLDSSKMEEFLTQLKGMADIIIIEAPPFFVAETSILAAKVDGILAVIRPGYSKKDAVKNMADQIARSHAHLLGVALHGIPAWGATYFAKVQNHRYMAR